MNDLLIKNARLWTLDEPGTIENGWLTAKDGLITAIGGGNPPPDVQGETVIDARGKHLLPGLADCHTHLMEYATAEVHRTRGGLAQEMAAISNLLTAMKCGIAATGEHHLGHPVLDMPMERYKEQIAATPMKSAVAYGCCYLGFAPPVLVSATRPGVAFGGEPLTEEEYRKIARESEFPGENIFLNYTPANAPLEAVPYAGKATYDRETLQKIIHIFHSEGKPIGAHVEGDDSARLFIECGGDVIHHGHQVSPEMGRMMAEQGVKLVITPSAGTSKRPTSPEEALGFYRQGVFLALASDSYIPPHPEANWIPLPPGYLAGPEEFLKIVGSTLRYFVEQGVSQEEALRLITVNGRKIIRPLEGLATLTPGCPADMILADRLPALETEETEDIKTVILAGRVQVDRR